MIIQNFLLEKVATVSSKYPETGGSIDYMPIEGVVPENFSIRSNKAHINGHVILETDHKGDPAIQVEMSRSPYEFQSIATGSFGAGNTFEKSAVVEIIDRVPGKIDGILKVMFRALNIAGAVTDLSGYRAFILHNDHHIHLPHTGSRLHGGSDSSRSRSCIFRRSTSGNNDYGQNSGKTFDQRSFHNKSFLFLLCSETTDRTFLECMGISSAIIRLGKMALAAQTPSFLTGQASAGGAETAGHT